MVNRRKFIMEVIRKMGMSTSVIGFREPDEEWKKMKKVYDTCRSAGVEIPHSVDEFFNGEPPSDVGIEVDIKDICEQYAPHDVAEGFKIEIAKLPKSVTHVCFWNSW